MAKKKFSSYVLRNITQRDINLGDLRYKIPAGKSRDLFAKKSNLRYDDIIKSKRSGSISKYLCKKFLVETKKIVVEPPAPRMEIADPSAVTFPQRIKSSITIEVGGVTDEIRDLTISEDDELLKQMEEEAIFEAESAPIVAKKDE